MVCRICQNIRQNRDDSIYCRLSDKNVGLNQQCSIDKYELDGFVDTILKESEEC